MVGATVTWREGVTALVLGSDWPAEGRAEPCLGQWRGGPASSLRRRQNGSSAALGPAPPLPPLAAAAGGPRPRWARARAQPAWGPRAGRGHVTAPRGWGHAWGHGGGPRGGVKPGLPRAPPPPTRLPWVAPSRRHPRGTGQGGAVGLGHGSASPCHRDASQPRCPLPPGQVPTPVAPCPRGAS